MAALVGGGLRVKPGEVSLAHLGVLFLDELPEFQRGVLDCLRQPIETGEAVVARANAHVRYPARFQLVAAMNPCRCGYLSDPAQACGARAQMRRRLSVAHFRPAARPHRPACRSGRRHRQRSDPAAAGRRQRRGGGARGHAPATSSASATKARPSAPMPKPKANCWTASPRPMRRAASFSPKRPSACGCRRAAITGCCAWRAPSPIWPGEPQILRPHIAEALSYRDCRFRVERGGLPMIHGAHVVVYSKDAEADKRSSRILKFSYIDAHQAGLSSSCRPPRWRCILRM